ncbi:MAG: glutamate mutase L [Eubacteriales bacterium]|nr:glutamate mutase L [Eubacteriales bacterium]
MTPGRMIDAVVAEIGSTTTVVSAFDGLGGNPVFLGQGMAPTTAQNGDVLPGLEAALEQLKANMNAPGLSWRTLYAASSAAGGLFMSVHGLVYEMTARAAQMAALGAGAVVRLVTAGKMGPDELEDLLGLKPNLILLAGGTDYGDRETALHNARAIAGLGLGIPVLYAGNSQAAAGVARAFERAGQPLTVTENVYPSLDLLNIEPARREIQKLFETHIVKAPGMAHIRDMVDGPIMPTPGAVMEALRILQPDIGDVLAVDIGGATTDVHSGAQGSEDVSLIQTQPEPFFKRTVEGDLGLYINAGHLAGMIGLDSLSRELDLDAPEELNAWQPIPQSPQQYRLAGRLALEAGLTAIRRHAGTLRQIYLPEGRKSYAAGKDLSEVTTLIATGGALTRLPGRGGVLRALRDMNIADDMLYPKPQAMKVLVDRDYLMASLGVLSRGYPEAALALLKKSLSSEGLA